MQFQRYQAFKINIKYIKSNTNFIQIFIAKFRNNSAINLRRLAKYLINAGQKIRYIALLHNKIIIHKTVISRL